MHKQIRPCFDEEKKVRQKLLKHIQNIPTISSVVKNCGWDIAVKYKESLENFHANRPYCNFDEFDIEPIRDADTYNIKKIMQYLNIASRFNIQQWLCYFNWEQVIDYYDVNI